MLRFNSVEAQQQVVAELDSALNSWLDNIPAQCALASSFFLAPQRLISLSN